MPRRGVSRPVDHVVRGDWPDATISDHAAAVAQALARNLASVVDELGVRALARDADVSHTTVSRVLAGETWPDLMTIARLERAAGRRLWPRPPFEHEQRDE